MENLIQYNSKVSNLFHSYLLSKISKDQLIENLHRVEEIHREAIQENDRHKSMWFKFSTDDTLVNTIGDLDKDLSDSKNKDLTIERMRDSVSPEGELLIYYS